MSPGALMLRLTVRFWLAGLALLTLSRLALVLWMWPRVSAVDGLWPVMLGGLRMDVVVLAQLSALIAVLGPWFGHRPGAVRFTARWYRFAWVLLAFFEICTPQFLLEYDSRPNRLFFEYLVHPREVGEMLVKGYWGVLIAGLVALGLAIWASRRIFPITLRDRVRAPAWRVAVSLVLLCAMFMGIRGTLAHRPINPSTVAFSGDAMVNVLPLNGFYSVSYAAYRMKDERSASALYGDMSPADAVAIVRAAAGMTGTSRVEDIPTLHAQTATVRRDKPLNVVMIVEESLGAQYVGTLGGRGLTPELDALYAQGWGFDRAYATGTRSVRGLEALSTGFLPTPAEAVVKLPRAQTGFFSLAALLGQQGYRSRFVYGGEAHFDNMRGFFLGNGFDEVVDRTNAFRKPDFVGSWGASDEDMFDEVHRLLSSDSPQPTFTLAFSVSNHAPWEYPQGRITPEGEAASVDNTVRYADWALGEFFRKARQSPYWDNTLFVVVADHDARVGGASLVPVRHFHIPAVILGADVAPRRDDRLISQIDLGPTLLSLMGIDSEHPMPGRDLTRATDGGRAIMQYGDNFAYLTGDDLLILEPHKPAQQFGYTAPETLVPREVSPELARTALGHALWPEFAYRGGQYRLPAR